MGWAGHKLEENRSSGVVTEEAEDGGGDKTEEEGQLSGSCDNKREP